MSGAVKVELVLASMSSAQTYLFLARDGHAGWASCTVSDATGEVSIQSDWGDGAHRWYTGSGLGAPSLTHFLAQCHDDSDYLARKLLGRDGMERFDPDATTQNLFRGIIAARRNGDISREQAREAWDALGYADDLAHMGRADAYVANVPDEVRNLLDVGEHAAYVASSEARAFKGWILPALTAACRAEAERRAAQSALPAAPPGRCLACGCEPAQVQAWMVESELPVLHDEIEGRVDSLIFFDEGTARDARGLAVEILMDDDRALAEEVALKMVAIVPLVPRRGAP